MGEMLDLSIGVLAGEPVVDSSRLVETAFSISEHLYNFHIHPP